MKNWHIAIYVVAAGAVLYYLTKKKTTANFVNPFKGARTAVSNTGNNPNYPPIGHVNPATGYVWLQPAEAPAGWYSQSGGQWIFHGNPYLSQ